MEVYIHSEFVFEIGFANAIAIEMRRKIYMSLTRVYLYRPMIQSDLDRNDGNNNNIGVITINIDLIKDYASQKCNPNVHIEELRDEEKALAGSIVHPLHIVYSATKSYLNKIIKINLY
eukprot:151055_1